VRIGARHGAVFKHIEQRIVFTFYEWRIHGNVARGHTQGSFNFVGGNFEQFCEFLGAWFAFELLFKFAESLVDFVERANFIQGQTHDSALFGQGLQDALTDPPNGVRNEFEASGFVETLGSFDKPQVAFVDKVRKAKSLILILFCNRNNKTQVRFREFFQGYLVALFDSFGEVNFFFGGQEVHLTNLLQILLEGLAFPVRDGLCNF